MPSPPPLQPGRFYHLYNRGNNRENLFREEDNYRHFLRLYAHHAAPMCATFAYALLPNHFHLLVRTETDRASQAFSNLFNAYTKAFNRRFGRTGSLFEHPFRRIEITDEQYFAALVRYIHQNPQRHGLIADFRDWPHSSWHALMDSRPTRLERAATLEWFGGAAGFMAAHEVLVADPEGFINL